MGVQKDEGVVGPSRLDCEGSFRASGFLPGYEPVVDVPSGYATLRPGSSCPHKKELYP
jgi:hypothetical protein